MRVSLLVLLGSLAFSTAAFAEGTPAPTSAPSRGPGVVARGKEAFGTQVAKAKEKGFRKGFDVGGSAREGKIGSQTGTGNAKRGCQGNGQLGTAKASGSLGVNADTFKKGGADKSWSKKTLSESTGSKCGRVGQIAGVGVEASVVKVAGDCATAVGTFGGKATGVGASASASACEIEAKLDLIYGEVSYETPSVSGCGVTASAVVTAGAGVGVGAGVGRLGTVGGKGRLGPVKLGVGANVSLDKKGAIDCAQKAWAGIKGFFGGIGSQAKEVLIQANAVNAKYGGTFFLP